MKKVILAIAILFAACTNGTNSRRVPKLDTVRTVIIYTTDLKKGTVIGNFAYKIVKDTFTMSPDSDGKFTKSWYLDSDYYVPVLINLVDSLKRPLLDSAHKQKTIVEFQLLPKSYMIYDFNKNYNLSR